MSHYNIDSHKLHLHPRRVAQWLDGESIYPIYIELSPSGACNHRCVFCTMDFMGYKTKFLDTALMRHRLPEMAARGVKAIMFAGEGEPLLHKDICTLAEITKTSGVDVSFTTNAVLLSEEKARRLLPVTSWVKVSCNAGSLASYAAVHRTKEADFTMVMRNMAKAVEIRKKEGYTCTLGFQCILLPENKEHLVDLARMVRDLGADYLVIKPYTRNHKSLHVSHEDISYTQCQELEQALFAEQTDTFSVVYRSEAMQRWDAKQVPFSRCLALPFWAYVDAEAHVWGCLRYLKDDNFLYGNLHTDSFAGIWQGQKRSEKLRWCQEHLDIRECHTTCRMEVINMYLHRLINPEAHDNFI